MKKDNVQITLICFAVPAETAPFQKSARQQPTVRLVITGMGKQNAERAIRGALEQQTPALVLSCGFAGGLDPALAQGTVVFDADTDSRLAEDLEKLGAKRIRFHCAARVAATPNEKHALRKTTGADAVEMESEYIRAFCRERNIPSATIRVISDTADEALPLDFHALMTPEERISYTRLAFVLMKSPAKIPQLLAFRKRAATAAKKLAQVLNELLQARG